MFPKSLLLTFIGLLLATFSVWAGMSALEGVVKDPAGHPVKGADVRIEATNGSSFARIVKTDAAGHYTSGGLAVGIYKVTVIVNGAVKASIPNAYTQSAKPTELNFELAGTTKVVKTHRVWVAADTGTHIGNGTWVDVDDNGNIVSPSGPSNSGVSSIDKLGAFRPTIRTARPPGQ
jgi:Carboxypeptidase regulatory-like domain